MTAETRQAWIDALRSGKYEQGRGALRCRSRYCCLGVLLDVIDPTRWEEADGAWSWDRWSMGIPTDTAEDFGLVRGSRLQPKLMAMNDSQGRSFDEIAYWIEHNIPAEGDDDETN